MAKKPNQWSLDRAYYLIESNENKTKELLKIIRNIENNVYSPEDGMSKAADLGLISSYDRYMVSGQTLFNSFGFIYEPFKLTEVGNAFVDGILSYKDLLLLQLLKKEFKYDDNSEVVRPFFITLNVLRKIYSTNKDECWIDCYDYQKYLTEVKSNNEINECVKNILNDRKINRVLPFDEYKDFEVWMYAFRTSGLILDFGDNTNIKVENQKFTLNLDELDLIDELIENENKFDILGEYNHRQSNRTDVLKEFGKLENGFFNILPNIEIGTGFEINNLQFNESEFVQKYFFTKLSHQNIDHSLIVSEDIHDTKGFVTTLLVRSLGFANSDYKGILCPYRNRKDLIKLSSKYKKLGKIYELLFNERNEFNMVNFGSKEKNGINKIYYGAPGCGKSFKLKKDLDNVGVEDQNRIRTVFHPEFTNSDFVGQILPTVHSDKSVTYEFNPGPFTLAVKQAIKTNNMVYLIIEEINRGNAAAIFGDLFQLLDRQKDGDQIGRSEYDIENPSIEKYLIDSLRKEEKIDLGDDYHLFIPSNLTILATMNSSDQNVFTLDTAFKRRWYFEQIDNGIIADPNHTYKNYYIPGTDVTWSTFMVKVNDEILKNKIQNQTNEDKRMGKYFVTRDCLVEEKNKYDKTACQNFAYKVLEYLWNDVCRIGKESWFDLSKNRTLEELINSFMFNEDNDPLKVFINIDFRNEN